MSRPDIQLLYRLRKRYQCECTIVGQKCKVCLDRLKAADEIERLHAEIDKIKSEAQTFKEIAEHYKLILTKTDEE
jgi:hypothetical protein